jgi:hypothetical protein
MVVEIDAPGADVSGFELAEIEWVDGGDSGEFGPHAGIGGLGGDTAHGVVELLGHQEGGDGDEGNDHDHRESAGGASR